LFGEQLRPAAPQVDIADISDAARFGVFANDLLADFKWPPKAKLESGLGESHHRQ
jgi:hypothetical protein